MIGVEAWQSKTNPFEGKTVFAKMYKSNCLHNISIDSGVYVWEGVESDKTTKYDDGPLVKLTFNCRVCHNCKKT